MVSIKLKIDRGKGWHEFDIRRFRKIIGRHSPDIRTAIGRWDTPSDRKSNRHCRIRLGAKIIIFDTTMKKAIFWDNDGVLVDTERLYFAATRQILATVGVALSKDQFIELILVQGKGAWHLAIEQGVSPNCIGDLRNQRDALYSRLLSQDRSVIDGAGEVLEALHGHYVMGVVTSSRKEHFKLIHRSSGLLKYFDFILTGDDYIKYKPNPEPYLLAVQKSGFRKEECIAIEDSERGLKSAKSAGISCIVIPTELTKTGNFSQADKIAGNIKEILTELQSLG